jgi:pSer/pThr/pTyr-binding forkhead associated (FHA) protein
MPMCSKVVLSVTQGSLVGKEFIFNSPTNCVIGRAKDCNIQLPNDKNHAQISRYHCLLKINFPNICIQDIGSTNGTYVNGKLIGKKPNLNHSTTSKTSNLPEYDLHDGHEITLGDTVFKVNIQKQTPASISSNIPKACKINPQQATKQINNRKFWNFLQGFFKRAQAGDPNLAAIKGYTLVKELGRGGFGQVYLAFNQQKGEFVALKVMLPQKSSQPKMLDLFRREARSMKLLNHPNLVKLKDYCFANGLFFFTMEYCSEGTLKELMESRGKSLEIDRAIKIVCQILDGLHYTHQKGLVHRDIKPANIFFDNRLQGETIVKLGDYGLAKAFEFAGLTGHTVTGTIAGSPAFIPRQLVIDFKYAKPEVDVWMAAATLYYMLTFCFPRDFTFVDPFLSVLNSQPIPIRLRDSSIPQSLAKIIDLALEDRGDLYFKDALSFKQALSSAI